MDSVYQAILGQQPSTQSDSSNNGSVSFDPSKSYGTPSKILDNLQSVESSGNQYAVNPNSKTMGAYQFDPSTAAMLNKMGVKFNPFDQQQARAAADWYLQKLYKDNGGDWQKAVAQFGGFKTKDPSQYVNNVLNGVEEANQPMKLNITTGSQDNKPTDPVYDAIANVTKPSVSATPKQQEMTPWNYSEVPDYTPEDLPNAAKQVAGNIAATADVPLGIIPMATGEAAYWMGRAQGLTPEQSQQQQQQAQNVVGSKTTIGGLTGMANMPEYQGSIPNKIMGLAGTGISFVAKELSKVTGANEADIENAINTGMLGLPEAIKQIKARGGEIPAQATPTGEIPKVFNEKVDPNADLRAQFAQKQAEARAKVQGRPVPTVEKVAETPNNATPQQINQTIDENTSPVETQNPIEESVTNPEITPTDTIAPDEQPKLSNQEINTRANILKQVGQTSARQSAINGNHLDAASEAQMTKFDEPAGRQAADQFNHEHDALHQFTSGLITDLGSNVSKDENTSYERGQVYTTAVDQFKNWFDNKIQQFYDKADEAAAGTSGTDLKSAQDLLNDPTFNNQAAGSNLSHVISSAKNQLQYFLDRNGGSLNVKTAEDYRKFLNAISNKDNNYLISQIKNAVDNDVISLAGDNVYKEARDLYALKQRTLENPAGMFKLFDYDKNDPTSRKTSLEKIPSTLWTLPADQFENVISTFKSMPKEISHFGDHAINETKAQFLNTLLNKASSNNLGVRFWKNKEVNKLLLDNSRKLNILFSPKELDQIKLIKHAGDINSADPGYPGAAAQAANAVKRGLMSNVIHKIITGSGAGIGSSIAGPFPAIGATIGAGLAEPKAVQITEKMAANKFKKKLVNIKDIGK